MLRQHDRPGAPACVGGSAAAVAAVRPAPYPGRGRLGPVVLVGVDGTRSGQVALALAAARASAMHAGLVGVHVPPGLPWSWSLSADLVALAPQWRQDVEEAAFFDTAAAAERTGVDWSFVVQPGEVAAVLRAQAAAHGAILVVVGVGTRHRRAHRCPARRLAAGCERQVLLAGPGSIDPAGGP